MKMVFNTLTFRLTLLIILFACCKKKTIEPTPPYLDSRLIGAWQCEGIFCINNPDSVYNSNMDTVYSKSYLNKKIIINITEGYKIDATNYHWEITGTLNLTSNIECKTNLTQLQDKLFRPNSDYQPKVVNSLNESTSYWIEGNGSSYSKLYFYFNNKNWVARFTKL